MSFEKLKQKPMQRALLASHKNKSMTSDCFSAANLSAMPGTSSKINQRFASWLVKEVYELCLDHNSSTRNRPNRIKESQQHAIQAPHQSLVSTFSFLPFSLASSRSLPHSLLTLICLPQSSTQGFSLISNVPLSSYKLPNKMPSTPCKHSFPSQNRSTAHLQHRKHTKKQCPRHHLSNPSLQSSSSLLQHRRLSDT